MAADAAMACLKNRNNHKQLNETSDFDNRFALRKDLTGMANDVTKKAYMLIRKEFGDSMWRQLGMDDCDERGLIDMLNDYQKHFNITNPQDLANKMLGRKTQEQEEMPQMERKDLILALSEYMSESWIDTGDDGDLDDIYYAIADILDETGDYPASASWEDCKPWCQKHYQEVEAKIY